MPRIRTTKPDHWEDENWNLVSLQAHLLFLGMKNFADDKGVIKDNAVLIKNKVFPTREDIRTSEVVKWLKELMDNSFLVPLEFEKKGYYVLDFTNERIDKPQPSILPERAFLQTNTDYSIPFENIPAVEERKGEVKGEVREWNYTHEDFFIDTAGFFGITEQDHFKNYSLLDEFFYALTHSDRLESYKVQFKNYVELKTLTGYEHKFLNFIGQQKERFNDGAWNAENWELKLQKELKLRADKEKGSGKKENTRSATGEALQRIESRLAKYQQ